MSTEPHESDPVLEERVRKALRVDRPDADAFRAEVERKLRDRRQQYLAAPWWTRLVASVAPFGGAAKLSPVGKSALGKSMVGAIALPVLGLLLLLVAFFTSTRKVGHATTDEPVDPRDARLAAAEFHRMHWRKYLGLGVAFGVLAAFDIGLAVTLALCGFMLSVACLVGFLGRQGLADRAVIAGVLFSTLIAPVMLSHQLGMWMPGHGTSRLDPLWITVLGMAGLMVCGALSFPRGRVLFTMILLLPFGLGYAIVAAGPVAPPLEELVEYVESFDSAPFRSASWREFSIVAERAVELGAEPDWTVPLELMLGSLDDDGHPSERNTAMGIRLGMLSRERVDAKLSGPSVPRAIERMTDPRFTDEVDAYSEWLLRALVQRGRLDSQDLDVIEAGLYSEWPERGEWRELEDILFIARMLEVIDRPLPIEAHRTDVFERITAHQVRGRSLLRRSGGFDASADADYADGEDTLVALRLMQRFGVPPGVDMNRVRSFLMAEAKPSAPFVSRGFGGHWEAAVALSVFDQEFSEPRTWWQAILDERLFLGAVLFVALMIFVVLRAPRAAES